jgi:hypothetical protein
MIKVLRMYNMFLIKISIRKFPKIKIGLRIFHSYTLQNKVPFFRFYFSKIRKKLLKKLRIFKEFFLASYEICGKYWFRDGKNEFFLLLIIT